MPFRNPIMGGGVLVRDSMQSENFVTGLSGWIIRRDGTWEFSNGIVRGELIVTNPSGAEIHVLASGAFAEILFQPPDSATPGVTFDPAVITATSFGDSPALEITGPSENPDGLVTGQLRLYAVPGIPNGTSGANLEADSVAIGDTTTGSVTFLLSDVTQVNGQLTVDGADVGAGLVNSVELLTNTAAIAAVPTTVLTLPNMTYRANRAFKIVSYANYALTSGVSPASPIGVFRKTNPAGAIVCNPGRFVLATPNDIGTRVEGIFTTAAAVNATVVMVLSTPTDSVTQKGSAGSPRCVYVYDIGEAASYPNQTVLV